MVKGDLVQLIQPSHGAAGVSRSSWLNIKNHVNWWTNLNKTDTEEGGVVQISGAWVCSQLRVAAHVCVQHPLSSLGLGGFIQTKRCETLRGAQSAGKFQRKVGWSSRVKFRWVYFLPPCLATAVLWLSHVLSHGVTMFGRLVGGCGLWRVGTGGQGVGDGHSSGNQPFHRRGNPTRSCAHHAGREPAHGTRGEGERSEI